MASALLDRLRELLASVHPSSGGQGGLSLYLGTALAALVVLLVLKRATAKGSDGGSSSGGRIRRAMSFTSAACAEGALVWMDR